MLCRGQLRALELTASASDLRSALQTSLDGASLTPSKVLSSLQSNDKAVRWGDTALDGRLLTTLLPFALLHITLRAEKNNGETSVFFECVKGLKTAAGAAGGSAGVGVGRCEEVVIVVQYEMHINACVPATPYVALALSTLMNRSNSGLWHQI